jgi:predicted O-linked N-acetylglucosamine transferase (SPINDLY family)
MSSAPNPVNELMSLYAAGRLADMETCARAALRRAPESPILNELLGIALSAQQRHPEAIAFLEEAARRHPGDAQFWENLALCQRQLGRFDVAESSLRRSLALRPSSVEALNALGSVLRSCGRLDEAEQAYRRASVLAPQHAATQFNLGKVLLPLGRLSEAEACFRRAIALNPSDPASEAQLGTVLNLRGDHLGAVDAAHRALGLVTPANSSSDLLNIIATVLGAGGRRGEASNIFRRTRADETSVALAFAALSAARSACDWELSDRIEASCKSASEPPWASNECSPFTMLMMESATPEQLLIGARSYAQQFVDIAPQLKRPVMARPKDRLRIGYLSGDFCNHAVSHLFVGVVEAHDRCRFEIVAYDYSPQVDDGYRRRLVSGFERMVALHELGDDAAAQRIADDECHIVVDLKGWTAGTRGHILAARPAPIQAQWLGYPGTLGAPWIDYIVADRELIRPGEERYFSEQVIRLPGTYQPTDNKRAVAQAPSKIDAGLPERAFVFCSFNQSFKITRNIFEIWMELLHAVEGSVLWLLELDPEAKHALLAFAADKGVEKERVIFAPWVTVPEHLARLSHADLGLDCFPYGSHTTASDALWGGLPIVALAGDTFASRVSSSILAAAGLRDLVTTSFDEYRELALRLATERIALAKLRSRVRDCRDTSALFDTAAFTRHLEAAFSTIWDRHVAGLPAAPV